MSLRLLEEIKMVTRKLEELAKKKLNLCGLYLMKGDKKRLYEICIKYGIPITYPRLFEDDTHYYLWGIRKTGVGLVGTIIMNYLSENNGTIFHSLEELEEYLKHNSINNYIN